MSVNPDVAGRSYPPAPPFQVGREAVRAFASVFNIPYFALGGELTEGYVERAKIVAQRLLSGIIATVVITAIAYSFFFAGARGGLQAAANYPPFGWTIGLLMLAGGLVCCLGVWRYAAALPQPVETPNVSPAAFVRDMVDLFRNASFRILFGSMLTFASAAGVNAALNTHVYVFAWKLAPETIQFLSYALLLGITAGIPLTPPLLRRMEKRTAVLVGFVIVMLAWSVMPLLFVSGVFAPTGAAAGSTPPRATSSRKCARPTPG